MRPRICVLRVLACATLVVASSAARAAAAVDVTTSGGSIVVTGTGSNDTDIRFSATPGDPMPIQIVTQAGGSTESSPDCQPDVANFNPGIGIDCSNLFGDVQASFGPGNDVFTFNSVCFNTATITLGDGTNEYHGANCSGETVTVTGGSGQDTLTASGDASSHNTLFGGAGVDTLTGGEGDDVIHGGDGSDASISGLGGNDQLFGDGGDDVIRGGAGDDVEQGGAGDDRIGYSPGVSDDDDQGADVLSGGDGSDQLLLDGHTGAVTITLDGQPNDGATGEGDNVAADFEDIQGTGGNDVFTGSPGPDHFSGGFGNDEIHGGGDDDDLYGGGGDDKIYGDAGNDKLQGANGSDTVDGGAGVDQIYGDIASCSFSCSFDADTLFAADGEKDAVDCGGGSDTAHADQLDVVTSCASVDRVTIGGAPPSPGPSPLPAAPLPASPATTLTLTIASGPSIARGVGATVACPASCTFTVSIVIGAKAATRLGLGHKAVAIGTAHGTLLAAGTKTVTVKLTAKAKRRLRLRHVRRLATTLKVSAKDAAGKATSRTKSVTLGR